MRSCNCSGVSAVHYEIWEAAAGNCVGTYPTLEAALSVVRESVTAYGKQYAVTWLLGTGDEGGGGSYIAEGRALVDLALGQHEDRARIPA